jgi:hypothetical protein
MALEAIKLSGRHVELVPLAHEHHDGLAKAVQDGNLWQLWYTGVPAPEAMSAHIDRCLGLQPCRVEISDAGAVTKHSR